jgi:DNA-binding protein H-NS
MAKSTYAEIQKQIAELQSHAAAIKQDEVAGVVEKIREAIEVYGLTPDVLFGRRAGAKKVKATAAGKRRAAGTQYSDGSGNVWGGRGPRP